MAGLRWHRFLALARPDSELPVRRSELRAPRKPFSSARHVDREALTPHPELGTQVVRGYMFSCGQTRPKTICQASVGLRRCQQGQAMARHVLLELELDRVGVARSTRRDRTVRAPRSRSHSSWRPHLLRAGPPRPDAQVPTCPPPRGRSRLSASRASVALRVRSVLAAPRRVS